MLHYIVQPAKKMQVGPYFWLVFAINCATRLQICVTALVPPLGCMITIVYGSFLPPTALLYIRGKSLGHKTKQPLLYLGILRNVNNFYKIVDIFLIFYIFFSTKKWEIMLLYYFHEYANLLHFTPS
jgi:hypothetical protein